MAITPQEEQAAGAEFADGFNNPPPAPTEVSDDEAFGLSPEIADDNAGTGSAPSQTLTNPDQPPPGTDPNAPATPPPSEAPTDAAAAGETPPAPAAQEDADEAAAPSPTDEAAEAPKDAVDAAVAAAKEALSADFGEEFVKLIETIAMACAAKVAGDAVTGHAGEFGQKLAGVTDDLDRTKQEIHFDRIAAAHSDYREIANSPEFGTWVKNLPDDQRAAAQAVIERGSAHDVIALLSEFKKTRKPAATEPDDDDWEAAAGVRSTGMRLPDPPPASADYEDAWDKA